MLANLMLPTSRTGLHASESTKSLKLSGLVAGHPLWQAAGKLYGASLLGRQSSRHPVEAFKESITGCCACVLEVPLTVLQVMQAKLVHHLGRSHGIRQILLVRKHKDHGIAHLILLQDLCEFFACILDTVTVIAINYKDQALSICVIVPPQLTDLVLAADIPDIEVNVLVLNGLDIEANGWDRCHHLTQLQLVQDRSLPCCVKTNHQHAHLPH